MAILQALLRKAPGPLVIGTSLSANGIGSNVNISRYKNIGLEIVTVGFTGTIKIGSSFQKHNDSSLDFSTSASDTNRHNKVAMWDLNDNTFTDGSTGLSFTTDTGVYQYEVNAGDFRTINAILSAVSAGNINVRVYPAANI